GGVLAWVGSPNYQHFQYDYVTSKRQVASTFKPIVFATALEQGFEPCDFFRNDKITYTDYDNWTPENFDNKYGGRYSIKGALANSVNVVAVRLLYEAKRDNVIELAKLLGIESDIPAFPSIALGVADISLKEMVQAYSVFANEGLRREVYLISKIEDRNGKVLYSRYADIGTRVLSENNAIIMRDMLENVVLNGTGKRLVTEYKIKQNLAGKTGTAQNYSDGWFIGFSPTITAGAWVGGDKPAVRFKSGTYGQGSRMAMPIFGEFMKSLENDSAFKEFTEPLFPELSDELAEAVYCEDFMEDNTWNKLFNSLRDKDLSDEKIRRQSNRNKFFRKIFK
ncbi:MAG: hypothetical protein KDC92_13695, partial [Bacteroidetes bacterium]|nr:hypothetical protein [Bacteroidota bacterium]